MILVHVTTVPETYGFFRGQIAYMKARGFEIHAISSPGYPLEETAVRENISVHAVNMPRRITPIRDISAVYEIYRLFRKLNPAIVHAHTPKGGLLGVMAARLAQVPVVIYGMRGLPFITATGLKRKLLFLSEAVSCRMADRVIANSFANRQTSIAAGLCHQDKIRVLAFGSSNGVDAECRFNPKKLPSGSRGRLRQRLEIPKDSIIVGFVGRIVKDKGIIELEKAWQGLRQKFPNLYLILVGSIEHQDSVPETILESLESDDRVRFTGMVKDPVPYYGAIDLLVLPTYREGLPNTLLEAGAMELSCIATRVDGCEEAVVDEITGLLVPPGNSEELARAVAKLVQEGDLRKKMGKNARKIVLERFRPIDIWENLYHNYLELLKSKTRTIT